jgi:hypothetical protein
MTAETNSNIKPQVEYGFSGGGKPSHRPAHRNARYTMPAVIVEAQLSPGIQQFDLIVADEAHRCAGKIDGALAAQWEEGFAHLEAYPEEHKDCRVPRNFKTPDGFLLGQWVQRQCRYRHNRSENQKTRLDALGFVWDARK